MLLVNGSVCVAKKCEVFLSSTVQWNRRECELEKRDDAVAAEDVHEC